MVKAKRDLTVGPIFSGLVLFTIPIILTGLLQDFYNMADNIVVGRFSGDDLALAAVSSTGTLTALLVKILMGFATGSGIVIAQAFGSKNNDWLTKSVHTAMTFSLISGVTLGTLALIFSNPLLSMLGTKAEVFDSALLYFRIICIGIPASTVYNFGNSTLRSVGDSKTPLYILLVCGFINVLFNLFFVIVCGMSVEGVAIATITSQYLSAISVVVVLFRRKGEIYALNPKKLGLNTRALKKIILFGLPASIQSSIFNISNLLITSSINTLPTASVSARAIVTNIDSVVSTTNDAFVHATTAFVAQNYGAKKMDRLKRGMLISIVFMAVLTFALGRIIMLFGNELAGLFVNTDNAERDLIISEALSVCDMMLALYFICGAQGILSGTIRGLGNSLAPMLASVIGICSVRVIWVFLVFPIDTFHSLRGIYMSFPASWIVLAIALLIIFIYTWKKSKRELLEPVGTTDDSGIKE